MGADRGLASDTHLQARRFFALDWHIGDRSGRERSVAVVCRDGPLAGIEFGRSRLTATGTGGARLHAAAQLLKFGRTCRHSNK